MFLVLAHADDRSALRVHRLLAQRHGAAAVALVSADALALAPLWEHRLDERGDPDGSSIELADGCRLDDRSIGVVLNRLRQVEAPQFARASPADRDYAQSELYSLVLSWLASLAAPVVNPVSTRALCGPERSLVEWLAAFADAGLSPRGLAAATSARGCVRRDWWAYRIAAASTNSILPLGEPTPASLLGRAPVVYLEPIVRPAGRVLVVGDRVLGDAPEEAWDGCRRLAGRLGCDLLEVAFGWAASGALLAATATVCPSLCDDGEAAAVADWLEARRGQSGHAR
jgi:hypothetical protein